MPPTKYYKRPIPAEIQGVVVDGKRLGSTLYVPLRNGMTVADAAAYRELLISRAHQLVNFRLTEVGCMGTRYVNLRCARCTPQTGHELL